jgi:nucleolin
VVCSFGYAEFASAKDAQKAINGMNGEELDGRSLRLDAAAERKDGGGGGGGGRGTPRGGRGTPRGGRGGKH